MLVDIKVLYFTFPLVLGFVLQQEFIKKLRKENWATILRLSLWILLVSLIVSVFLCFGIVWIFPDLLTRIFGIVVLLAVDFFLLWHLVECLGDILRGESCVFEGECQIWYYKIVGKFGGVSYGYVIVFQEQDGLVREFTIEESIFNKLGGNLEQKANDPVLSPYRVSVTYLPLSRYVLDVNIVSDGK